MKFVGPRGVVQKDMLADQNKWFLIMCHRLQTQLTHSAQCPRHITRPAVSSCRTMPCSREPTRCWPQGNAGAVLACSPTCTRTPGFAPTLAMRCVSADELDRQNQQPSTGAPEGWPCAVPFVVPAWLTVISRPISSAPCSSLQARSASSSFWYWMNPNARSFPDPAKQILSQALDQILMMCKERPR